MINLYPCTLNIHVTLTSALRLFIKFGYLGWLFTGYQSGNGNRSVEDSILNVLRERKLADSLNSAARTDRNVSAIGNVIALNSEEKPQKILGILNSSIDGMIFHQHAEVADDANPRHCDFKTYRYIVPGDRDIGPKFKAVLGSFVGTHDFSSFCRVDNRNTSRFIKSIMVKKTGDTVYVDFIAGSFLWNQIRTIMAYALDHSFDEILEDPFRLKGRYPKLVQPDPLILIDIEYRGLTFEKYSSKSRNNDFRSKLMEVSVKNQVLTQFASWLEL